MNRELRLLAGGLFLILSACRDNPAPAAPPAPVTEPAVRILAFGDSLTAGKDLEDPDQQAFPAILERRLNEKGHSVSVTNAGVSGDTTANALARLDFSLQDNPSVVIVGLGSNDTFQGKPLSDVENNLEAIVRRSRAAGATVVLCGMKTFPNLGLFYAVGYDKIFPRVAARQGAILVPFMLDGVAGVPSFNLPDGIHPNTRGHERVAETLLPYGEKALADRRKS